VRGHWLSVFLAIVVNILVFSYFPIDLSSQIIVQLFPTREYAYAEMIGRILGFLVSPLNEVYNVLLFMRLRHLSSGASQFFAKKAKIKSGYV
jgi:hypothetical protein